MLFGGDGRKEASTSICALAIAGGRGGVFVLVQICSNHLSIEGRYSHLRAFLRYSKMLRLSIRFLQRILRSVIDSRLAALK